MGNECCDEKKSCCTDDRYCEMSSGMTCLANEAWGEVMKEKMKAIWEKEASDKMDKVAPVVIEHTKKFWEAKMQGEKLSDDEIESFKKDLMAAFS